MDSIPLGKLSFRWRPDQPAPFIIVGPHGFTIACTEPPDGFALEHGAAWHARAGNHPTAEALEGATVRETHALVDDIPPGAKGPCLRMTRGGQTTLAGHTVRRELVAPDGTVLMVWDAATDQWTEPPATLPPGAKKSYRYAANRLSGKYSKGRPPNGPRRAAALAQARRAELLAEVRPIVEMLRAAGYPEPGQELVADQMGIAGDNPKRLLQKRVRAAGYPNWHALLRDIPAA